MRLIRELRSHLHYKIILPFLLLTLLVALAGSAVSFLLIVGTAQERLNNQLAQVARDISDKLVQQESDNLLFLRQVVFAQANPGADAPAIAEAFANRDTTGLQRAFSSSMNFRKAGASMPVTSMPSSRMRCWLSGFAIAMLTSRLTLRTMSAGRPAGPASANQFVATTS